MKNINLKTLSALAAAFCLIAVSSCKIVDADSVESDDDGPVRLLSADLAAAKDGDTVYVSRKTVFASNTEIVLDRAITLVSKTEDFDMKDAEIQIGVSGVTVKNLSNVKTVEVTEDVGEGDFTLENLTADTVNVKGGGAHSGHMNGCFFGQLNADFKDVRLVFGFENHIGAMQVKQDCRIETSDKFNNSRADFGHVKIHEDVEEIHFYGRHRIDNCLTRSKDGKKPKIVTESKDISISKAGDIDDSGTVSTPDIESGDEEIDAPFYDDFTDEEAAAEDTKIDDITIEDIVVDSDTAGCQTLNAEDYGINVKWEIPSNVNHINVYRSEYGKKSFYLVGIYTTSSRRPLSGFVNWVDYYVEKDSAYTYYATFISNENNNIVKTTEQDTITAKGGLGILQYTKKPVLNFDADKFNFTITGDPEITVHGEPTQKNVMFYFRPASSAEPSSVTVESTLYSLVSVCYNYNKMPAETTQLQFVTSDDIGRQLVLYKIKANVAIQKNDIKCQWVSIPEDGECGTGFDNNKIKFTYAKLPFYAKNSEAGKGIDFYADLNKFTMPYGDGSVYKFQFVCQRDYDNTYYYVTRNGNAPYGENVIKLNCPDVSASVNNLCKIQISTKYDKSIYTSFTIAMYIKPATGNGENHFKSGLKITDFSETEATACLNAVESGILEREVPEALTLTVDDADLTASKYGSLTFVERIMNVAASNVGNISFEADEETGSYSGSFSKLAKDTLYWPYSSRGTQIYTVTDAETSTTLYKIEYGATEDSLNYVKGLPEPFKLTEPETEEEEGSGEGGE